MFIHHIFLATLNKNAYRNTLPADPTPNTSQSQHLSSQAIKRHGQQQKVLHVMRSNRHYTSGILKPDYRVTAKQSRTSLFVVNEYVKHTSSYDQHNHLCLAASQKLKKTLRKRSVELCLQASWRSAGLADLKTIAHLREQATGYIVVLS